MWYLFIILLGFCVGSFLNVVIYRLKKEEGVIRNRSYCPNCGHKLDFLDLVPVFSFIFLKGKCRYCGGKISWQYPAVELGTGVIFLLIFVLYMTPNVGFEKIAQLIFLMIISSLLIVIFVYDLKHYIIPDRIVYPALGLCFFYRLSQLVVYSGWNLFLSFVLAGLGWAGFFLLIYLLSKGEWLGFGDVKLALLMGLLVGFPGVLIALFSATFLGSIVGIILVLLGKKSWRSQVPFAPFLVAGSFVGLFWGEVIAGCYLEAFII